MIRAEVRNPITDTEAASTWLSRLVEEIGMVICPNGGPHVHYVDKENNCGIAAIVMIETSHCSLHVWDKADPPLVQFDVYSCSDYEVSKVLKFLDEMNPAKVWWKLFNRETIIKEEDNSFRDYTDPCWPEHGHNCLGDLY